MTIMEKLKKAAADWIAQFEEPPEILLKWTVSPGILYLNDTWICPFKCVKDVSITDTSIDLMLDDGTLSIIILKEYARYEIVSIERWPRTPDPLPEHIPHLLKSLNKSIDYLWQDAGKNNYLEEPEFLELIHYLQEYRVDLHQQEIR